MIYITDQARDQVHSLMKHSNISFEEGYFVRVSVVSGGCSGLGYKMDFDNEKHDKDQVFEHNNCTIVTDLKSFLYLVDCTLDFSSGLNGRGFHFVNPNAGRSCGCGDSFSL